MKAVHHVRHITRCLGAAALALVVFLPVHVRAETSTTTVYSLSSARLDGVVGENTYVFNAGSSGGGAELTQSSGNLNFTMNVNSLGQFNYGLMVGHFSAVSLQQVGSSITMEYAVTTSANSSTHLLFRGDQNAPFRIGFFDSSAGSPVTANSQFQTSSSFDAYAGYAAYYGGRTDFGYTFKDRDTGAGSTLFGGTTDIGSGYSTGRLGNSTGISSFTGVFTLERISATEIRITSKIGSATAVQSIVSASLIESFDTFGIAGFAGETDSMLTFTKLDITAVTPIPEPGSWGLVTGLFGIMAAYGFRRGVRR